MSDSEKVSPPPALWVSLLSGGIAGTSVDVALFPLDTIKTRLQAPMGFYASGGFSRIYAGLGPAALGSAPNAALFFLAYDTVKGSLTSQNEFLKHSLAASAGEISACLIRVPVEIVKQRRQASSSNNISAFSIAQSIIRNHGALGLYRGYLTTVSREVPFSVIQFPLWEHFKHQYSHRFKENTPPAISASFGALAGGIAAGLTTPLDVAKTRIMLSDDSSSKTFITLRDIYMRSGPRGLFAGVLPRMTWMSLGRVYLLWSI
uniref:S-adenosylmethionine mitochondrial carrier protein n=1 Tax=Caligus rogercresseyi TaxID=217165 RepID=C1BRK7_CALRO|nr:S-adenosylmethionine mitochondrial carrier protein [Caligus rogercresseyi]